MGRKVMQAVADWLDRFSGRALAAAIAFVLVVDGAYAVHFRSRIRFFDEGDYLAIAKNLASGRGIEHRRKHRHRVLFSGISRVTRSLPSG